MIALRIIAIAALQTAALVYMVFDRTSILNAPDVVTLEVRPVDPQDMFRGDYVVFGYAISEIYTGPLAGDHNCVDGAWCYVTLENQNGKWSAVAVDSTMPTRAPGKVVLRGRVAGAWSSAVGAPQTVRLSYGIESFFVPQGQGKPIEEERQKGGLTADIAVDAQGRGAIKTVHRANGQVLYVESLF
jgi:uncharacterized membrane-anchored protein